MVITTSSFAAKSMLTNQMISYAAKSIINPTSGGGYYTGIGSGGGNCSVVVGSGSETELTNLELETLAKIEQFYTSRMASKNYANIPTDFTAYLKLYDIVYRAQNKYHSNRALALLFQITHEGLTGSMNAYGLNTLNIELTVQNTYLQGVLEEIISGVNVTKAFDQNVGTLAMKRSFELAPLFQYYIKIYGLPAPGAGFDPVKLNLVLTALENSGIDPYGN